MARKPTQHQIEVWQAYNFYPPGSTRTLTQREVGKLFSICQQRVSVIVLRVEKFLNSQGLAPKDVAKLLPH